MSSQAAQQFLLLAKSVRGSAAVDLVTRVLEHPDIFGFDEFLRHESLVKSIEQDYPQLFATLILFAYGTLSDYESNRTRYISLSPLARRKLQLLTLASLAVHARILPYTLLLKQLQIESVRELEDLIIDGIYAQVIRGKLDQLNNRLSIEYAIARDVNTTAFDHMEDVLDKWCKNCSALLNVLKYEAMKANEQKKKALEDQDKYEKEMLSMIKIIDLQGQGSGGGGSGGGGRRDNNENNNNNLSTLQSLSNMLTGNTDSKQGGTKKSARQTAKRFFRP
jgi:COP9 signalosome complex subunit 7